MKFIFTHFVALFAITSFAQIPDYFGNSPSWSTEHWEVIGDPMMPTYQTTKKLFYVSSTTTIDAYEYYIIRERKHITTSLATGPDDFELYDNEVMYARQEGRAIYARIGDADSLFISYEGEVGDTIGGHFGYMNPGYTIHNIDSIEFEDGTFRLELSLNGEGSITLAEGLYWRNSTFYNSQYFGFTDFNLDFYGYDLITLNFYCYAEYFERLWPDSDLGLCFPSLEIPKEELVNNVVISPNPGSDQISLQNSNQSYTRGAIIDLNGKVILRLTNQEINNPIDISQLNNGVFILQLENENGEISQLKFVKN